MLEELKEIKEVDTYILKLIQDVIKNLNIIDEMIATNGERQSRVDLLLSDYLHLLERKDLSDESILLIAKEIQKQREIRRHLRNEFEVIKVFEQYKNRLISSCNREFFTTEVYKVVTQLNQLYKSRILTEEEIDLLCQKKTKSENKIKKSRRKTDSQQLDDKIWELYMQNTKQVEIAKMMGVTVGAINHRLKRMKERKLK